MRKVLVVEDEFLIAAELEETLSGAGYTVVSAVSTTEVQRLFPNAAFGAAIVDFHMGGTVADLAHLLATQGVPLIFCTGSHPDEVRASFADAAVLSKPFAADQVLGLVESVYRPPSAARC